jgi:hypothetical protein
MKASLRVLAFGLLLLAAACSLRGAIDRLVAPEDKAFAMGFVDEVRRGEMEKLRAQLDPNDPKLWATSLEGLPRARALFPVGVGETRLISYNVATSVGGGSRSTSRSFVLVTTDGRHWTKTNLATFSQGGPQKIVGWNVQGLAEPPPELVLMDGWEKALPWIRAGAALIVALAGLLIWWLVRRSRRSRRAAAR